MSSVRRVAFLLVFVVSPACNAITGAHERFLESGDGGGLPPRPEASDGSDGGEEPGDGASVDDAGDATVPEDGGPEIIPVDLAANWVSPNGAGTAYATDAGRRITSFASATHPVIFPATQPNIPSEDYTVHGTVRGPPSIGEFGILTRVQPNGANVVMSSSFGQAPTAFVGNMSNTDWNPGLGQSTSYTYVASARYRFLLRVTGKDVSGKFWVLPNAEPTTMQFSWTNLYATGRGVGFYTYGVVDAVVEELYITVP